MLFEKARAARWRWLERRRRVRFYRQFAAPGDLCFDIGANVGDRTGLFLAIPASVVAVEPQSLCQAVLEQNYGNNPRFTLVRAALGPEPGEGEILKTASGSVYASMSPEWIERVRASGRFETFSWDAKERVEVTTLDAIVERHGKPAFCKIDVEGYEREVLEGLTTPIRALSIEFAPEYLAATEDCVARLLSLGAYEFNYSLNESLVLEQEQWMSRNELLGALEPFRDDPRTFGDVYARLRRSDRRRAGM